MHSSALHLTGRLSGGIHAVHPEPLVILLPTMAKLLQLESNLHKFPLQLVPIVFDTGLGSSSIHSDINPEMNGLIDCGTTSHYCKVYLYVNMLIGLFFVVLPLIILIWLGYVTETLR